jgi:purine/pyrimidine-nucleoside phosphorylase
VMETVAGACRIRLAGSDQWQTYGPGQSFDVPGNSSFDIVVEGAPYHYICHFG